MSNEKIIPYDQPDLVKRVTVTGWVSTDGRFYGDNEDLARYASCTHVRCACGGLAEKPWTACDPCRVKNDIERYNRMPKREWDGSTMLYSDAADRYFQDYEEVVDHLRDRADEDPPITVDDLRLTICEPNIAREIDGNDHFCDDLPEDGEIPAELEAAFEALNAVIRKLPPLSWSPGKTAAIVEIDPKDLA
ncbi:MAG: hypothetical protein ACTHKE_03430 [Sphingomicrobium sp.]